jgi:[acyl-carrier-protein] S-malonyltransferase
MDVVLLFPGQARKRMAVPVTPLAEARDVFQRADAALGAPLSKLCFEGPADELTLTHNAQPALLAHGAAVWAIVKDAIGSRVVAAAGHSLGELTAYHAAGSLDVEDAVRVVRRRGELMYESGVKQPGKIAAILGDIGRPVEENWRRREASGSRGPANYNCRSARVSEKSSASRRWPVQEPVPSARYG